HAGDHLREKALTLIDDSRIAAVLRRQEIDDAADVLGSLPRRRQVKVLRRLGAPRVKELTSLLAYDQDTAGRLMNTRFLSFLTGTSAADAVGSLRRQLVAHDIDDDTDLYYAYILDGSGAPLGVLSVRELLSSPDEATLDEVMAKEFIAIAPEDDREKAARLIADYDLSAIPVIAEDTGKMLGIITVDDVLDIIEEELTEDLLKLAGTEDKDTVGASLYVALRSRMPWLAASWCGGIVGALLLGAFETTLERVVALAFFMPVVFGMGGNVGSQSSTITVRGLATGELGHHRIFGRLQKECAVGLALGLTFGLLLAAASFSLYGQPRLSAIVGLSIFITMTCAAALGSMLPVMFERLGIDPAVASGPLVTTTTDILSITIYCSVATALLT
ncbi:MAG: magnesium transporter, partial [Bdellovibrionales bacterium]|nr:magnesium transporter [Bdellovibrionales bacterium]